MRRCENPPRPIVGIARGGVLKPSTQMNEAPASVLGAGACSEWQIIDAATFLTAANAERAVERAAWFAIAVAAACASVLVAASVADDAAPLADFFAGPSA